MNHFGLSPDEGSDLASSLGLDIFTTRTDHEGDVGVVDMGYHYYPRPRPPIPTITIETAPIVISTLSQAVCGYNPHSETYIFNMSASKFVDCPAVYHFDHWEGEGIVDPNSANTTLYADSDQTIRAIFEDRRECGDKCHPIIGFDLNRDCWINLQDLAYFSQFWMLCTAPECD